MSEKRCYTVKELQEILGVSRPTIYNLLKKNEFRWIQLVYCKIKIPKVAKQNWRILHLQIGEYCKIFYIALRNGVAPEW